MDVQTNNNTGDAGNNQSNIMKELSDIKSSLATNTEATANIKESVNDVKGVVKEMQKNYITQEQHKILVNDIADHEIRIRDKVDKIDYDEFRTNSSKDILALKETKNSQTILISIGIGLLVLLTSMLLYHIFGMKL